MRATDLHRQVFKSGSRTYFNSSVFFPAEVRDDVHLLYGFVRVADDFVDSVPQQVDEFRRFVAQYRKARSGSVVGNPIIDGFVELETRKGFDPSWTDAFLHSMEMDITKKAYFTVEETLEYVYGSAEVIGLYMSRIMSLDAAADHAARLLGRSMQFINFIRDISEDNGLGRTYLPLDETTLDDLTESSARSRPDEFVRFLQAQLARYGKWQAGAEAGYRSIPRRYLIPIRTASDMYNWTARMIARDPFVVFERKVKPSRFRIVFRILRNALAAGRSDEGRSNG